jgi:hypothetical protein
VGRWAAIAFCFLGCTGVGDNNHADAHADGRADLDGADVVEPWSPTAEDRLAFDDASDVLEGMLQLFSVTDSMFDWSTLDGLAAQVVQTIGARTTSNLQSCGSVGVNGTTVTVDFGSSCTLRNGAVVAGTLVAVATDVPSCGEGCFPATSVTLTLGQNFVIDAEPLQGTASFDTTYPNHIAFKALSMGVDTTYRGKRFVASALPHVLGGPSISDVAGAIKFGAAGSVSGSATLDLAIDVSWNVRDCYPFNGSMSFSSSAVGPIAVTFSPNSALSGEALAMAGNRSTTLRLPPYRACGANSGG